MPKLTKLFGILSDRGLIGWLQDDQQSAVLATVLTDQTGQPVSAGSRVAATTTLTPGSQSSSYTSADIAVGSYTELAIDYNLTAITGGGAAQVAIDRKDGNGNYVQIAVGTSRVAAGSDAFSLGMGGPATNGANVSFGSTIRIRVALTGGVTPTMTFTISVIGK